MPNDNPLISQANGILSTAPHLKNNPGVAIPLILNPAAAPHIPAIAGLTYGQSLAAELVRLPEAEENKRWESLSNADKSLARAAGYELQFARVEAERIKSQKGFWGRHFNSADWAGAWKDTVEAAVDGVWDEVIKPVGTATKLIPGLLLPDEVGEGIDAGFRSIEPAKEAVVGGLKAAGGGALDAWHYVTDKTDRFYRAGHMAQGNMGWLPDAIEEAPGIGVATGMLQNISSFVAGDFGRWWDEADRANAPIDPDVETEVLDKYGPLVLDLVRRHQKDPEDLFNERARLIAEAGSAVTAGDTILAEQKEQQARDLDEMMASPLFKGGLDMAGEGLLSAGRNFAGGLGLRGTPGFEFVSGFADGIYRLSTDPLLVGGKAISGYRAVKYGLVTGDAASATARVEKLFETRRVQRYFDDLGKHLEEIRNPSELGSAQRAVQQIERNFKSVTPALRESMVKAGVTDAATARAYLSPNKAPRSGAAPVSAEQYLKDAEGYMQLVKGRAAFGRPLMPYRTAVRKNVYEQMAKAPRGVVDWLAAGPKILRDDLLIAADDAAKMAGSVKLNPDGSAKVVGLAAETAKAVQVANEGWRGRSATAHRRLSVYLPTLTNNKLDLLAPGADDQVQRIAAMFGPKYWARQVGVTFLHANEVGRRDIVKGLYATMFEATGVMKTAEGRVWATQFFKTMDDTGSSYSVTDVGVNAATGQRSAIFLSQAQSHMPVPNFAEVYAQAAKLGAGKTLTDSVNTPMVDWYMNTVWRPSVLLRPALAYRNGMDEMLNQYIRQGPGRIAGERAGMRALNRRQLLAHQANEDAAYNATVNVGSIENQMRAIYGAEIDDLAERAVVMRADAAALRTERQGAGTFTGIGSAQARRAAREAARKARKARADDLDARAAVVQDHANGLAAARGQAQEAKFKLGANPDAFDTEMGRMFRFVMAGPHRLGEKLGKNAPVGSTQAKIAAIMTNAGKDPYNFYRAHVYGKFSETALKAFNPSMVAAIDDLVDNPYARDLFQREIMDTSVRSARMEIDNAGAMHTKGGRGGAFDPGKVKVPGDWGKVTAQGEDGASSWSQWFDRAAADPVGRHMLLHIDDQEAAITGAIRIMKENKEYANRMSIVQGAGAPERFAVGLYHEIRVHLSVPAAKLVYLDDGTEVVAQRIGDLIPGIVEKLRFNRAGGRELNEDAWSVKNLQAVPADMRPDWVHGVTGMWMQTKAQPMERLVKGGFKTVGDMTAWMSRQHQFVGGYTEARNLLLPLQNDLIARMGGDDVAEKIVRDRMTRDALDYAVVRATSYIDNPAIRTQAAVTMRNFAPFWRAQQEFFMRWGRAMKYNPEAMGRAMLGVHASTASGIVQKDENGTPFFVYPGSGVVHEMMVNLVNIFPGALATKIPIASPMTGKVQMLTPGFNPDGTIHIFNSPILAEPIRVLSRITEDPLFDEFEEIALGPGADRGFIESQVPALLRPLYQEYSMGDERHEMNTAAAIFSKFKVGEEIPGTRGHDGKPVRVPSQQDGTDNPQAVADFRRVLRTHSNGIRLLRSIMGPTLPAYPRVTAESPPSGAAQYNPEGDLRGPAGFASIRQEYFDLVKRIGESDALEDGGDPFGLAYAYWVKERPSELPFIIGQTEVNGSVPLSNAAAAGDFIRENRGLLADFPEAALFFVPQGKDFDLKTYELTIDLGLRNRKELDEFINDLTVSNTVSVYYEQRTKFYQQRDAAKAAGDTITVTNLNNKWSRYSDVYQSLNPLVADYLAQGQVRDLDRRRTFADMERLLDSGRAPAGPEADMYRALTTGWRTYERQRLAITGRTDYDLAQKRALDRKFERYSKELVKDSAAGKLFHGKLIENMEP